MSFGAYYGPDVNEPTLVPGLPRVDLGLNIIMVTESFLIVLQFIVFVYLAAAISRTQGVVAIILSVIGIFALFRLYVAKTQKKASACILYILWKGAILILHVVGFFISLVVLCSPGGEMIVFHSIHLVLTIFLVGMDVFFIRFVLKCQRYFWQWERRADQARINRISDWNTHENIGYDVINTPPPAYGSIGVSPAQVHEGKNSVM